MKYTSISNVEARTIQRVGTGYDELDWLYGVSEFPTGEVWGMPIGTISTWVGEGGVGKSRLAISIAKNKVNNGKKVLYLQNEVDLPTLAGWVNDSSLDHFYCSEVTALQDQVSIINELKPDLVFVDSINLVDEFGSGTAKSIKTIIDGFRNAIRGTRCHVIILCQLNKEGSATGSTALSHLPDVNINLTNTDKDGVFKLTIGKKHRYGRKGSSYNGLWKHIETGVECISDNRMNDDRWSKVNKVSMTDYDPDGFGPIPTPGPNDVMIDMSKFGNVSTKLPDLADFGRVPLSGPRLSPPSPNLPRTLDTCSPAVREAYYTINPEERPTIMNYLIKAYKKNWSR